MAAEEFVHAITDDEAWMGCAWPLRDFPQRDLLSQESSRPQRHRPDGEK